MTCVSGKFGRQQYILDGYVYKQFYVPEQNSTPTYFLEYYPVSNKTYLMKLDNTDLSVYAGDDKVDYLRQETWPKLSGNWTPIADHIPTQTNSNPNAPANAKTEKEQLLTEHYRKLQDQLSKRDELLNAINQYTKG